MFSKTLAWLNFSLAWLNFPLRGRRRGQHGWKKLQGGRATPSSPWRS